MRTSTRSTTNFEASGSTELIRSHHNVRDQWLLMQGTNKDASRCTGSVASDAGNQSPEQVCKKEGCEKLARHAFHVINVTLFGSRGTSSANSLSSASSRVSIPRFGRFREDSNLGSCINFQRKPRRTNSSQGARAASESFVTTSPGCAAEMTPTYYCSTFNETLFQRKCLQARFLVFQAKKRGRRASQGVVDTTTVHHQSSPNLSFANPAVRKELLSGTSVCGQLRHRRLPLLESLLQMTILPPVSIDSNARISETCFILCVAATRSLQ